MADPVTESAIRACLHTAAVGRRLEVTPRLDSTNARCRELAKAGAPEGTVVVAQRQSAGRGTRGRHFFSPPGGVYLSILLRPGETVNPGHITCRAAVATARAIRRTCGAPVGIKWVNDLLLYGRKVCGILAEGEPDGRGGLRFCVLGIGVNVAATAFPPELAERATSLGNEGFAVERPVLIAAILEEWERATAAPLTDVMAAYRRLSLVPGRAVTVRRGDETFAAVAQEITDDGHLLVRTPAGERMELHSGEVQIRWETCDG